MPNGCAWGLDQGEAERGPKATGFAFWLNIGLWEWSSIMGRGCYKTGGRGTSEVLLLQKGWAGKVLAILKGGTTSFRVVLCLNWDENHFNSRI